MDKDLKEELNENKFEKFKNTVKELCMDYVIQMAKMAKKKGILLLDTLANLFEQNPDANIDDAVRACVSEDSIECLNQTKELLITILITQMRVVDFSQRDEVINAYEDALDEIDPDLKEEFSDKEFWMNVAVLAIDTDKFIKDRLDEFRSEINDRTDKVL